MNRILESKEKDNTTAKTPIEDKIEITEESRQAFIRAVKIGYYKEFRRQGMISDDELEQLIAMNTSHDELNKISS